jgi:hypothetical protein
MDTPSGLLSMLESVLRAEGFVPMEFGGILGFPPFCRSWACMRSLCKKTAVCGVSDHVYAVESYHAYAVIGDHLRRYFYYLLHNFNFMVM